MIMESPIVFIDLGQTIGKSHILKCSINPFSFKSLTDPLPTILSLGMNGVYLQKNLNVSRFHLEAHQTLMILLQARNTRGHVTARQIHAVDVSSAAQTALHASYFLRTVCQRFFLLSGQNLPL
jgi:hypothetical protein